MFFFPLFDDNPTQRRPYVSWLIIAACIMVFFWQESLAPAQEREAIFQLGFIPANASGIAPLPADFALLPAWMTIFTSMFLHGGWMHIGGNMLYLWIFGDNVEESMGRIKFILFYALCGIAAALAQSAIDPASRIPMIGASGVLPGSGGLSDTAPEGGDLHLRADHRFCQIINLPLIVLGIWIEASSSPCRMRLPVMAAALPIWRILWFCRRHDLGFPFSNGVMYHSAVIPPPKRWVGQPVSFSTIKAEAHHAIVRAKCGTHWVHAGSTGQTLQRKVTAQGPKKPPGAADMDQCQA